MPDLNRTRQPLIFCARSCEFHLFGKYAIFDYRGSGRASARETACRVAAGAIAKKLLTHFGITCVAYVKQIGSVIATDCSNLNQIDSSPTYCPDSEASAQMVAELLRVHEEGDSLGGVVEFVRFWSTHRFGRPRL